jgi:hypothetical protein
MIRIIGVWTIQESLMNQISQINRSLMIKAKPLIIKMKNMSMMSTMMKRMLGKTSILIQN